jgi:hypothetical protein
LHRNLHPWSLQIGAPGDRVQMRSPTPTTLGRRPSAHSSSSSSRGEPAKQALCLLPQSSSVSPVSPSILCFAGFIGITKLNKGSWQSTPTIFCTSAQCIISLYPRGTAPSTTGYADWLLTCSSDDIRCSSVPCRPGACYSSRTRRYDRIYKSGQAQPLVSLVNSGANRDRGSTLLAANAPLGANADAGS